MFNKNNNHDFDIQLGLAYDRALKQGKVFMVLFAISAVMNLMLVITITMLLPLKEIKPYFMPLSKPSDNYYRIIPADSLKTSQLLELARDYLKRYVADRHSVDYVTEPLRFKKVKSQSTPEVFAQVKSEYAKFQEKMAGVKRQIDIISDIALEKNYHQIEFRTTDITRDGREFSKFWVVNIRYSLKTLTNELKINAEDLSDNPNPLGLIISAYSWTERKNVKNNNGGKDNETAF